MSFWAALFTECGYYFKLFWDGIGYFGFTYYKLARLRRGSWGVSDKICDIQHGIYMSVCLACAIFVITEHAAELNVYKVASIEFLKTHINDYDVNDQVRLINLVVIKKDEIE